MYIRDNTPKNATVRAFEEACIREALEKNSTFSSGAPKDDPQSASLSAEKPPEPCGCADDAPSRPAESRRGRDDLLLPLLLLLLCRDDDDLPLLLASAVLLFF